MIRLIKLGAGRIQGTIEHVAGMEPPLSMVEQNYAIEKALNMVEGSF